MHLSKNQLFHFHEITADAEKLTDVPLLDAIKLELRYFYKYNRHIYSSQLYHFQIRL